jgi:hypothetical protein
MPSSARCELSTRREIWRTWTATIRVRDWASTRRHESYRPDPKAQTRSSWVSASFVGCPFATVTAIKVCSGGTSDHAVGIGGSPSQRRLPTSMRRWRATSISLAGARCEFSHIGPAASLSRWRHQRCPGADELQDGPRSAALRSKRRMTDDKQQTAKEIVS